MKTNNLIQDQSEKISNILKQADEISNLLKKIKNTLDTKNMYFKDDLIEKTLFKMEKNVFMCLKQLLQK